MALRSGNGKLQSGARAEDRQVLPPGLPGNIWSRIVRYYDCYSPLAWTLVWLINLKVKVTTWLVTT